MKKKSFGKRYEEVFYKHIHASPKGTACGNWESAGQLTTDEVIREYFSEGDFAALCDAIVKSDAPDNYYPFGETLGTHQWAIDACASFKTANNIEIIVNFWSKIVAKRRRFFRQMEKGVKTIEEFGVLLSTGQWTPSNDWEKLKVTRHAFEKETLADMLKVSRRGLADGIKEYITALQEQDGDRQTIDKLIQEMKRLS